MLTQYVQIKHVHEHKPQPHGADSALQARRHHRAPELEDRKHTCSVYSHLQSHTSALQLQHGTFHFPQDSSAGPVRPHILAHSPGLLGHGFQRGHVLMNPMSYVSMR